MAFTIWCIILVFIALSIASHLSLIFVRSLCKTSFLIRDSLSTCSTGSVPVVISLLLNIIWRIAVIKVRMIGIRVIVIKIISCWFNSWNNMLNVLWTRKCFLQLKMWILRILAWLLLLLWVCNMFLFRCRCCRRLLLRLLLILVLQLIMKNLIILGIGVCWSPQSLNIFIIECVFHLSIIEVMSALIVEHLLLRWKWWSWTLSNLRG